MTLMRHDGHVTNSKVQCLGAVAVLAGQYVGRDMVFTYILCYDMLDSLEYQQYTYNIIHNIFELRFPGVSTDPASIAVVQVQTKIAIFRIANVPNAKALQLRIDDHHRIHSSC